MEPNTHDADLTSACLTPESLAEVHPMRDGCRSSVLSSSGESSHRLVIYYETREQADAAQEWLAGDA